ncbi:hypothetical protein R1flu_004749 [Riccia fluitans]|uniref:Uncharacterized protein n=1 Tax=Riccia fluitans TaxID=41844 RepID=A0ABD1YRJ8_9MARC
MNLMANVPSHTRVMRVAISDCVKHEITVSGNLGYRNRESASRAPPSGSAGFRGSVPLYRVAPCLLSQPFLYGGRLQLNRSRGIHLQELPTIAISDGSPSTLHGGRPQSSGLGPRGYKSGTPAFHAADQGRLGSRAHLGRAFMDSWGRKLESWEDLGGLRHPRG